MHDWIQKHAESLKKLDENEQRKDANRNHTQQIIQAKGPEFWKAVTAEVEAQATKIGQVRSQYRTSFSASDNAFTLRLATLPENSLDATLQLKVSRVKIVMAHVGDVFRTQRTETEGEIQIRVDDNDQIHFYFEGVDYWKPEDLAGRFVRLVCGIPEAERAGA